ncbi:MAG: hypothetical protein II907_09680 [Firmicutes bacterium]|nr:hypothetical protein [Bacillota bacterium]
MGSDLNDELMRNVYSYQEGMSWRDMVLSLLIAAILSVTSVLFVVTLLLMWLRHRNYRKRGLIAQDVRFRPLPIVCFFLIQQIFLTKEFYTALYSLRPNVVNLFKIVIGLLILVIAFYGYRRKRDRFHKLILFSVILIVLDTARGSSFAFHLFSAALHYIALAMLASTGSGVTLQGVMQEPTVKAEQPE